jgi:hypothetical protein
VSRRAQGKIAARNRARAVADWQCPRCLERLRDGESCGCWEPAPEVEAGEAGTREPDGAEA